VGDHMSSLVSLLDEVSEVMSFGPIFSRISSRVATPGVGDAVFYPGFTSKKDLEWCQLTLNGYVKAGA
jgi:hypothetical protein